MKKNNLTLIIIIAGIAAAVCMLVHAFLPGLYKTFAVTAFMFALLGLAVLFAPEKKMNLKSFLSLLAVTLVTGVIAFLMNKVEAVKFAVIPVSAALASLGMILSKNDDYALSAAVFSAASAVYSADSIVSALLLAVAFSVAVAALNARKIKSVPVRVAAVFIICLALCAFK